MVERLRADLETERELYQALRREKDQQARQAGSELVSLSEELATLNASGARTELAQIPARANARNAKSLIG